MARRRLAAAGLLAAAIAAGLHAVAPAQAPTVEVLVAAADLPAGHRISAQDLKVAHWPQDVLPGGVPYRLSDLPEDGGVVLAGPIAEGEPVTRTRLLGSGLLHGQPPGTGATAVRLSEPVAGLLTPGDRVDVVAGSGADGLTGAGGLDGSGVPTQASVVVDDVLVLAVGGASTGGGESDGLFPAAPEGFAATGPRDGALILAVTTAQALRIRAVSEIRALSVVVRPRARAEDPGAR